MFERKIERPFELSGVIVVVNEPIYHASDESLFIHSIKLESRFEFRQRLTVDSHLDVRQSLRCSLACGICGKVPSPTIKGVAFLLRQEGRLLLMLSHSGRKPDVGS